MTNGARSYAFFCLLVYYVTQYGSDVFRLEKALVSVSRSVFATFLSGLLLSIGIDDHLNNFLAYRIFDAVVHIVLAVVLSEVFWPSLSFSFLCLVLVSVFVSVLDYGVTWWAHKRGRIRRCENGSEIGKLARLCLVEIGRSCLGLDQAGLCHFLHGVFSTILNFRLDAAFVLKSSRILIGLLSLTWKTAVKIPAAALYGFLTKTLPSSIASLITKLRQSVLLNWTSTLKRSLAEIGGLMRVIWRLLIVESVLEVGRYFLLMCRFVMSPLIGLFEIVQLVYRCISEYYSATEEKPRDYLIAECNAVKYRGRWTNSFHAEQSRSDYSNPRFDTNVPQELNTREEPQLNLSQQQNQTVVSSSTPSRNNHVFKVPSTISSQKLKRFKRSGKKILITRSGSQYAF